MLSNVSIVCFAASYAVALVAELSRFLFRAPVRLLVTAGFMGAGLFAHTLYLVMRSTSDSQTAPPLSSWYDWLLLVAWFVAAVYLFEALRRPQTTVGIFMLPLVLILVGVAALLRDAAPFPRSAALGGFVHGASLLLGSVTVMLGFVAGVMYLVQSYRLKHKLPPRPGFKLPTLEFLQRANKHSLSASCYLLGAGLLSGTLLNLAKHSSSMPWTDPVIWTSGLLFLWLLAVVLFEALYRPARQGRKVAYLTLASFLFLAVVVGIALFGPSRHAGSQSTITDQPTASGEALPPQTEVAP